MIIREIKEELDTDIEVGTQVYIIEYDHTSFHLSMYCRKEFVFQGCIYSCFLDTNMETEYYI